MLQKVMSHAYYEHHHSQVDTFSLRHPTYSYTPSDYVIPSVATHPFSLHHLTSSYTSHLLYHPIRSYKPSVDIRHPINSYTFHQQLQTYSLHHPTNSYTPSVYIIPSEAVHPASTFPPVQST